MDQTMRPQAMTDSDVVKWLDANACGWAVYPMPADAECRWGSEGGERCTHTFGDSPAAVRLSLARALGLDPRVKPEGSDKCPLPEVGAWEWGKAPHFGDEFARSGEYLILVGKDGGMIAWWVDWRNRVQFSGIARTRKGAQRAVEKAARRAWRVRNGGDTGAPTIERDWAREKCGNTETINGVLYVVTLVDRFARRVRLQPLDCWHERECARARTLGDDARNPKPRRRSI